MVVGMADLKVATAAPDARLVTYALGSCLGITAWDPVALVGGMLHVMLCSSQIDEARARTTPAMFVDTGVPELFRRCYTMGAVKQRMIVKVAGGAHAGSSEEEDRFQIGKRNVIVLRKLLWKNGVLIEALDVGGFQKSRTMSLDLTSGEVMLRTNGVVSTL